MGTTFDSLRLTADPVTGRVRWNRDAFQAMEAAGFFADGRYELLDGEIIQIMPNEPHTFVNMQLLRRLVEGFGWDYVRIPGSLAADEHNEPQPDVAVTVKRQQEYLATGIPGGSEFRLVVEISDATLSRDRGAKARLYAAAGVPEYWVVNLVGRTCIVHREPQDGEYRSIRTCGEDESVAPLAAPDYAIRLADVLPPADEGRPGGA